MIQEHHPQQHLDIQAPSRPRSRCSCRASAAAPATHLPGADDLEGGWDAALADFDSAQDAMEPAAEAEPTKEEQERSKALAMVRPPGAGRPDGAAQAVALCQPVPRCSFSCRHLLKAWEKGEDRIVIERCGSATRASQQRSGAVVPLFKGFCYCCCCCCLW